MLKQIKDTTKKVLGMMSLGFYHARAGAARTFRRVAADAEWGAALPYVRRIDNPIMDVVPPEGARLAIISQDAVPEFPAYIGVVTDDENSPDNMTVWVRADLQKHPGHLNIGGTNGVRVTVGTNDVDIIPGEDGSLEVRTATGVLTIDSQGRVDLGNGVLNLVQLTEELAGLVKNLNTNLSTALTPTSIGPSPLSTAALHGTEATAAQALVNFIAQINKG
jgi:streptogramin lyase